MSLIEPAASQHPDLFLQGCSLATPFTICICVPIHLDSSCKASCPSRQSTASSSLVSSENLLMVPSTPACRSFINILNGTGPRMEPCRTQLVTSQIWPHSLQHFDKCYSSFGKQREESITIYTFSTGN